GATEIKQSKIKELFNGAKQHNIYILCELFRLLSQADAKDLFKSIAHNSTVEINLPKDIEDYLKNLLTGDIASILTKAKELLSNDTQLLQLWINEIYKHFICYYYYRNLEINRDKKTWSG
ncbi:14590_t:CDS:1, partial [Dentiscutata erythropus]